MEWRSENKQSLYGRIKVKTIENFNVSDKKLSDVHVILLGGQSNMVGV
jgi:hypothetical protein